MPKKTERPYGAVYADNYDLIYGEKDYAAECELLEALFERHSPRQVRTILDLGCGTGRHAFPLAARGYQVTGVDRSEQMLHTARSKLSAGAGRVHARSQRPGAAAGPEFVHSEIQRLELDRRFDAVLMMFAVLGYLATDRELRLGLRSVRSHLTEGGLFVADFWYGPAVLAIRPSVRTLRLDTPQGELLRTAEPQLDQDKQRCTVRYTLRGASGELAAEETHAVRYFFPDELPELLAGARLELLELLPFMSLDGSPDETTWNALLCARAV